MLFEAADTLERDFNDMCLGGGYALGGDFCQSVTQEGLASRRDATVLAQKPSLRNIARDGVVLGQWSAANWDTLVTIGCGVAAAGFSGGTAAFAAARACAVTMTTYSALKAAQSHSVEDQSYAALGLLCFIAGERAKRGKAAADACGTALDSIAIKGSLHDLAERLSARPRLANPSLDPASRKGGIGCRQRRRPPHGSFTSSCSYSVITVFGDSKSPTRSHCWPFLACSIAIRIRGSSKPLPGSFSGLARS